MKKIALLLLLFVIPLISDEQQSQRFKVTYTITYNAQTLSEAAAMEAEIRKQFKDACDINIKVADADMDSVVFGIDEYIREFIHDQINSIDTTNCAKWPVWKVK